MNVNKIICDIVDQTYGLHGNYVFDYAHLEYLHQRTLKLGLPVIGAETPFNRFIYCTVENKLGNAYNTYTRTMKSISDNDTNVVERDQLEKSYKDVDNYLKRRLLNAKR